MVSSEIAFCLEQQDYKELENPTFIVPHHLPESTDILRDWQEDHPAAAQWHILYRPPCFHKGLAERFITRLGRLSERNKFWRNGIELRRSQKQGKALVTFDRKAGEVYIRTLEKQNGAEFMRLILEELNKILDSNTDGQPSKSVERFYALEGKAFVSLKSLQEGKETEAKKVRDRNGELQELAPFLEKYEFEREATPQAPEKEKTDLKTEADQQKNSSPMPENIDPNEVIRERIQTLTQQLATAETPDAFQRIQEDIKKWEAMLPQSAPAPSDKKSIKVFISYSSEDESLLKEFLKCLKPHLRRSGDISFDLWTDHQIDIGTNWKETILNALAECQVAILFVSGDFVSSEFIEEEELAHFFANQEDILIIPVLARGYNIGDFEQLSALQFFKTKYRDYQDLGMEIPGGHENELMPFEYLIEPKKKAKMFINNYGQSLAGQIKKVVFDKFGENVDDEPRSQPSPTPSTKPKAAGKDGEISLLDVLTQGDYDTLFERLKSSTANDSSLTNELVGIMARYNRLQKHINQGIVAGTDAEIRNNQIDKAIKYLISRL